MPKLSGDRGAISTLYAILLGSGVFMAILALVIDGGQIMVLKQLSRNAADSVAEAVAIHCAKTTSGTNCLADNYTTNYLYSGAASATVSNSDFLSTLANPKGGAIAVTLVCGQTTIAVGIQACPALTASPNDCQTDLAANSSFKDWVRVYTATDPNGFKPAFANFGSVDPATGSAPVYQETACSQVYWGNANAINVDSSGSQLPFLLGLCDVQFGTAGSKVQLVGEVAASACNYIDRRGSAAAAVSGSARGFVQFDPTAGSACWTLESSNCSRLSLATTQSQTSLTYPPLSYAGLISVMKNKLNRTVVLPVVDTAGTAYAVKGFVAFTLLAFKFPTSSKVGACAANSVCTVPGSYLQTWTGTCATAQSGSSPFCIAGTFSPRVIGAYGQVPGLTQTTSANVVNLGYQVIRHIR